jgi:hypothetical protein
MPASLAVFSGRMAPRALSGRRRRAGRQRWPGQDGLRHGCLIDASGLMGVTVSTRGSRPSGSIHPQARGETIRLPVS